MRSACTSHRSGPGKETSLLPQDMSGTCKVFPARSPGLQGKGVFLLRIVKYLAQRNCSLLTSSESTQREGLTNIWSGKNPPEPAPSGGGGGWIPLLRPSENASLLCSVSPSPVRSQTHSPSCREAGHAGGRGADGAA